MLNGSPLDRASQLSQADTIPRGGFFFGDLIAIFTNGCRSITAESGQFKI
ncbi:MAG: hypothetical protein KME27_16255 [Lyngbya sp. HA4199-MV5]|nr:hypothetical protein [Lyngbya sp. HA4199-MV5]